jgi:hypothetical protein
LIKKERFAEFLHMKIDKKRNLNELMNECGLMDIDKDGYLSE